MKQIKKYFSTLVIAILLACGINNNTVLAQGIQGNQNPLPGSEEVYTINLGIFGFACAINWNITNGQIISPCNGGTSCVSSTTPGITAIRIKWNCSPGANFSIVATKYWCFWGNFSSTFNGTIQNTGAVANAINGSNTVCQGQTAGYNALFGSNTTSYSWTVSPSSAGTVVSGQGTENVQILWNTAGSRTVFATPSTALGCVGTASQFTVNVSSPTTPVQNSGLSTICLTRSNITYSVINDPLAVNYEWILPPGASFAALPINTNIISVNFDAYAQPGDIIVKSTYACGAGGTLHIPVNVIPLPSPPSEIQGPLSICSPGIASYSISSAPNATAYAWSVVGGTIQSGQGTNTVNVSWSTPGTGSLSVTPTNGCGSSPTASTLNVVVHPSTSIAIVDDVTFNHNQLTSSVSQNLVFNHCATSNSCSNKIIDKAILHLGFNTGEDYNYGSNSFSTDVEIEIIAYGGLGNTGPIIFTKSVGFNINETAPEQLYQLDFSDDYYQIQSFEINVLGYTGDPVVQNDIQLTAEYKEVFKYNAYSISSLVTNLTATNLQPVKNQYQFSWDNTCDDFNNYEIQVLRLYNTNPSNTTNEMVIAADVDWSEAMTIETQSSQTDITLTLAEGTGYYVWRVRPIGDYYEGGIANDKNWGVWSNHGIYTQGATNVAGTNGSTYAFFYNQFDEDINWIYSRTFTEGDIQKDEQVRIAENMSFANGLKQVRQTQGHLSSSNHILTGQTVLDFSGRPALSSMAVPLINQTSLGFEADFIKNTGGSVYTANDFDDDGNYNDPEKVLDAAGEHFAYYSDNNSDLTIPSAEEYPFSRTLFYNDGNSRVLEQGGAGETFRIKSDLTASKTTKTYYSGVSDEELIRVFGTEAPFNESVHKVINIDGNSTATVTYKSKDGKTLATCLAINGSNTLGDDDAPLMGLASQATADFTVTDVIDNTTPYGDFGNQATTSRTFVEETTVDIHYELTPKSVQEVCLNLCKTCDYAIEITVQDIQTPDVMLYSHSMLLPAGICDATNLAPYVLNANVTLSPGTYVFTKRVVANNTDPTTLTATDLIGSTYLEMCLDSVRNQYDSLIHGVGGQLETINTYLAAGDVDGLYTHLGVDLNNPPAYVHVSVGCDEIEVPVILCEPCPDASLFAQYFDDFWSDPTLPTNYTFSSTSGENTGVYYSNIEFNSMIDNMLSDGYDCDALWDCWRATAQNYELVKEMMDPTLNPGLPAGVANTYNVVESFLNCAGMQIEEVSPSGSWDKTLAYKSFSYNVGDNSTCEQYFLAQYGSPASCMGANFGSCFTNTTWTEFYLCVTHTDPNPSSAAQTDPYLAAQAMMDTCEKYCEAKYAGYIDAIIRAFHQNEQYVGANPNPLDTVYPYSGDIYVLEYDASLNSYQFNDNLLLPTGTTFIAWSEIECMANALVQECKTGCTITPQFDGSGNLTSVGSASELIAFQNSYGGAYEVSVTCQRDTVGPWQRIAASSGGSATGGVNPITPHPHIFMEYEGDEEIENILTVTNTSDDDIRGSLRRAINTANGLSYPSKIIFELEGEGLHTIYVKSEMWLNQYIFIQGSSQVGSFSGSGPTVVLQAAANINCFMANSACIIEGLYIKGFDSAVVNVYQGGITIVNNMMNENNICLQMLSSSGNVINANILGTDLFFSSNLSTTNLAIEFSGAGYSIMGDAIGSRNTIANVRDGIRHLSISGSSNNSIMRFPKTRIFDVLSKAIDLSDPSVVQTTRPIITGASTSTITGTAPANTIIDVYKSVGSQQANEYLTTVTADANGDWTVSTTALAAGDGLVATATNISQPGTSELSDFVQVEGCDHRRFCYRYVPWPVIPDSIPVIGPLTCEEVAVMDIQNAMEQAIFEYVQAQVEAFEANYMNTCVNPDSINDYFTLNYSLGYHHYTLYYYNRAGSLIQTVPPQGVDLLDVDNPADAIDESTVDRNTSPQHRYVTDYEYNSLGQLVKQSTPDGGESLLYHNAIGQLRFSQDAQQLIDGTYSYTKYDELGRIIEVGKSDQLVAGNVFASELNLNNADFPNTITANSEVTHTVYTAPASIAYLDGSKQRYLLNRVSYSYTDDDGDMGTTWDQTFTYYSYDPHGNVEWLVQDLPVFAGKQYVRYEYDLVSGNVLKVSYNEGKLDQFYHRYSYDADNRINLAETSKNNITWEADAAYQYYTHGPLKRSAIGEDHVQGLDYVYTIQGWLKGLNHASLDNNLDPGQDGVNGSSNFAKDVFGMQLGYFTGDFKRSGSPYNSAIVSTIDPATNRGLYNGNISAWTTNNLLHDNDPNDPLTYPGLTGYEYRYDELNRIRTADFKENGSGTGFNYVEAYRTAYSYDANGNFYTLERSGNTANGNALEMDELSYYYYDGSGGIYNQSSVPANPTNKLAYVNDGFSSGNYTEDIDNQLSGNYEYDEKGQLIADASEEIEKIEWTVYNKVKKIIPTAGSNKPEITFYYDATGNRVGKVVIPPGGDVSQIASTWYSRDAVGNVMAIYESVYEQTTNGIIEEIYLAEQSIYGSSRTGERKERILMKTIEHNGVVVTPNPAQIPNLAEDLVTREMDYKTYEINDHLGNVRAVIGDVKESTLVGVVPNDFEPSIKVTSNYYPFGMEMPNRHFSSDDYRYGFNGMEKDDEVKGSGNSYDFGARILDPRVGRWLSLDPLASEYPNLSPYNYVGNNPIKFIDPDGERIVDANGKTVRMKFNKDGTITYKGKGQLSDETKTVLSRVGSTEIGQKYLKKAMRRVTKYKIEVRDALAVYNAPDAYSDFGPDSETPRYADQFQQGIDEGQFTKSDYLNSDNYFGVAGGNSPKGWIKKADGSGYFKGKTITVNTLSIIGHFSSDAAKKMSQEGGLGVIDFQSESSVSGEVNILPNPVWNTQYDNPQKEIDATLLHELTEGMFKNQTEQQSRDIEQQYKEQSTPKK